ncbi:MAG: adenylate kinase family protein, partial [Candidatus Woesearchaeota archaeon]
GQKIKKLLDVGMLAPDDVTNELVLKKYNEVTSLNNSIKGVIFDGYPRSYNQWLFVKENFDIDAAIEIYITDDQASDRMMLRRICPKCMKNYNLVSIKPKIEGQCDIDNTKLVLREDDTPERIKKRLELYHSQTEPLKKEYSQLKILHLINGNQPIPDVNNDIVKIFNLLKKN